MTLRWPTGAALAVLVLTTACSPKQMALNRMASALANSSAVYEKDNDPEFVRLAAPSTLKTVEMLLSQSPDHPQLLLTACSGFTQYAYAFLHMEAELRPREAAAADLRSRAGRMYLRARAYCLHGLGVLHPGLTLEAIAKDADRALSRTSAADVPWLYWTAAAWGAELSLSSNPLPRIGELKSVRVLLNRAKTLNEGWERGAIYEALIGFDGLPALLGGSAAAARADFERAMTLSDRTSVFAYVAYASTLTNAADRKKLLDAALTVDVNSLPSRRLTNLIAQRYARALLAQISTR